MRALEVVVKHGERPYIDDYHQCALNAPCRCEEMHILTGTLCTRCDEVWWRPECWQRVQLKFKLRVTSKTLGRLFVVDS